MKKEACWGNAETFNENSSRILNFKVDERRDPIAFQNENWAI